MQKAQQLKEAQDAATRMEQGISSTPFSLFNNPHFLTVASKIGVDVDTKDLNVASLPAEKELNPGRTVGSDAGFTTPIKSIEGGKNSCSNSLDSDKVWNLVCNNMWGKHPRTKSLL